jgi:two-component system, LytTR family, response regulator LytT
MRIVIVEDEAKTAADLKSTLQKIDHTITVLAILDSIETSVEYFNLQGIPDLVFMDIQLADGLSFEIFKTVNISCPVIFCTAFDEYAIEAFKVNGIDYILKPFNDKNIANSLQKVKQLESHFTSQNVLLKNISEVLSRPKAYKSGFLISYKGKMLPVSIADIACFYIQDELSFLVTFANLKYPIDYTLDEIETMIDASQFYRANRQFIIHYSAIKELEHYFARKLVVKVLVTVPESIVVSKAKASDFLRWMENR